MEPHGTKNMVVFQPSIDRNAFSSDIRIVPYSSLYTPDVDYRMRYSIRFNSHCLLKWYLN